MEPSKSHTGYPQHQQQQRQQQYPPSRNPARSSSTQVHDERNNMYERERRERELLEREKEKRLLREKEKEKERMQQEREKTAAMVSAGAPPKKKVEQRISTLTEAQVMDKLRKSPRLPPPEWSRHPIHLLLLGTVVNRGDPNDSYKRIKRVGQG